MINIAVRICYQLGGSEFSPLKIDNWQRCSQASQFSTQSPGCQGPLSPKWKMWRRIELRAEGRSDRLSESVSCLEILQLVSDDIQGLVSSNISTHVEVRASSDLLTGLIAWNILIWIFSHLYYQNYYDGKFHENILEILEQCSMGLNSNKKNLYWPGGVIDDI